MITQRLSSIESGLQYQEMTRFFITGVSSGIGLTLTKELIKEGHIVWGVSRRKVKPAKDFTHSSLDLIKAGSWKRLVSKMRLAKFIPQVIVFNAAILENDYRTNGIIDTDSTRRIMETNYFSILRGFNELRRIIKRKTKIIFIGSSSAFKGSGEEGIGYSGSKAALATAFESLYQKLGKTYDVKIIHFGPVKTAMVPFKSKILFMRTPRQAARAIIKAINSNRHVFYYPWVLFLLLRIIKLLPSQAYLSVLEVINSIHKSHRK